MCVWYMKEILWQLETSSIFVQKLENCCDLPAMLHTSSARSSNLYPCRLSATCSRLRKSGQNTNINDIEGFIQMKP